jgi:hypothetical protein
MPGKSSNSSSNNYHLLMMMMMMMMMMNNNNLFVEWAKYLAMNESYVNRPVNWIDKQHAR